MRPGSQVMLGGRGKVAQSEREGPNGGRERSGSGRELTAESQIAAASSSFSFMSSGERNPCPDTNDTQLPRRGPERERHDHWRDARRKRRFSRLLFLDV